MNDKIKKNIKYAMDLYFKINNAITPEQMYNKKNGAFTYLKDLGLVKQEHYAQYIYAAEMQYAIYRSRR